MATTTIHAQLIRYTTDGDQIIVNLKSDGGDISIDRSTNTKLPTTVTSAQTLADALGSLAFKNSLGKGDVGLGNVDNTADSAKSVKYATSAGSAGSATKATQDSAGQQINSTYVKSLSVSGRTITITKGDNTTSTLTTQDTNTTYGVFAKATADAAGGTGLVPAPAKGQQGLYLRGDGAWATPTNTVYTHPNSGVTAGTYRSVTVNAQGHVTSGSNPTTLGGYGITDAAAKSHKHVAADITDNIPASKISGVLSLSNIPAGALERLIPVADDPARFKLTTANAQNGDVIKVTATGKMYFVKDDTKLSTEDGYEVFVAGTAAAVAWTNVTGRPSSMPASDVYAWAKASSKPSYSKSEVGLSNVDNTADSAKSVKYATSAGSATSASNVVDSNDGGATTFAYSKAGLNYGDYTWLAAWNGKEMRAVNKSQFAQASHTHNYAGSSSAGGAATSANKLATARAINGVNFDGTAGITVTANPTSTDTNNGDLNSFTTPGFYYGGGSNTCKNKPSNVDAFGLIVFKTAAGYITQLLVEGNTSAGKMWLRQYNASTWSGWSYVYTSLYKPSKSDVGLGSVDNTADSAKSVKYATSAGSAGSVAWGNVSGRPSSMPASDVYAWAKASSKPSYSKSEVGLGNVDNTADSAKSVKYATSAGSAGSVAWGNVSGKPSTFAPSSHGHSNATASASGFMPNTDKAKLDFGDIVYVSKTAPTRACIWVKLD